MLTELLTLLNKWQNSKFYRGNLSTWIEVNPQTSTAFLKQDDIVSFIPMEALEEGTGEFAIQERKYKCPVMINTDLLSGQITRNGIKLPGV